jgi:hypothetical protein
MSFYSTVVRPLAFSLEAERAHHLAIKLGASMAWAAPGLGSLLSVADPRLTTEVAGLRFRNPIGLAAGYDKNGLSVAALGELKLKVPVFMKASSAGGVEAIERMLSRLVTGRGASPSPLLAGSKGQAEPND